MRWFWIIPAILIMIMPEAVSLAVAADPVSLTVGSRPVLDSIEPVLLVFLGGLLVCLAAIGRKSTGKNAPNALHRMPHAPAFPQARN
mgnify:CR=1 FL=1